VVVVVVVVVAVVVVVVVVVVVETHWKKDWVEPCEFTFVVNYIWCSKEWHFFKNEPASSVIRPTSKRGLVSLVDWSFLEDIAQMYALELRRGNKTKCNEECVKVTHGFGIEVW